MSYARDESQTPKHRPPHKRRDATGDDADKPMKGSLLVPSGWKAITASPGTLYRGLPADTPPLSYYELQCRIAEEMRHDPESRCNVPLDASLFDEYTGTGRHDDAIDDEEFDFRCLMSSAVHDLRMRSESPEPGVDDPANGESECSPRCDPYRSAGCGGDIPAAGGVPCSDWIASICADDEPDCDGARDCGTPDNPISGGLWFESMVHSAEECTLGESSYGAN